ncbi:MAG: tetratricopeptide repeat protein, partial [Anaerolineae bacterium]
SEDRVYIFEHQLTLEAAYGSVLHRKRRILHRRVAEALERLYPLQVEARLGVLAEHWQRAGDAKRALDHLQRAGEQAAAQYANVEALDFLTRALALSPEGDEETRYELLAARERIHHRRGDREAQTRDLNALGILANRSSDARRRAEVALRRAEQAAITYHSGAAFDAAQKALELAREVGDAQLEALAYRRLAQAKTEPSAASVQALPYLERALTVARFAGLQRLEAEIQYEMGAIQAYDHHLEGQDLIRHAIDFFHEVGDRVGEGWAYNALALTHGGFGHYEEARAAGRQALAILREIGDRRGEGFRLMAIGYSTMSLGLFSEALGYLTAAQKLCRQVEESAYETRALVCMGVLFDLLGDYEQAWSKFEEALELPVERAGLVSWSWALEQKALLLIHCGDPRGGLAYAQRALDFLDEAGDAAAHGWLPSGRAMSHAVKGHALLQLGDGQRAIEAYRRALGIERKAGAPGMPYEFRAGLARAYLSQGEMDAALAQVEQILSYLETGHVYGTMEPTRTYLTCYRVLAAAGDARADGVLHEGHELLMAWAANVDDEDLRRSYLENVTVNRELAAVYRSAVDGSHL